MNRRMLSAAGALVTIALIAVPIAAFADDQPGGTAPTQRPAAPVTPGKTITSTEAAPLGSHVPLLAKPDSISKSTAADSSTGGQSLPIAKVMPTPRHQLKIGL